MAIPDFQSIMLPLLKLLADGQEHSFRDVVENLALSFKLSEAERKELLPSGQQIFDNRVGWARTYMKKAGLLDATRRGFFKITQRGLEVLKQNLSEINIDFLSHYPEFMAFREIRKEKEKISPEPKSEEKSSPEDLLVYGYQK
ncbi:MAG: hypothetical protein M0Z75_05075 [Nitrospiraceae bacterium]|nr:hypothetical protein [Nitrospiraceae bacterium]